MVRVTWKDHTGKQHKKSKSGFKTEAQAHKFAAEIEKQKYSGQISTQDSTFYQYFLDLRPIKRIVLPTQQKISTPMFRTLSKLILAIRNYQQLIDTSINFFLMNLEQIILKRL